MASTLVLLRHAKSAYPLGVDDHDRPLNGRGRRDAPVAGRLITENVGTIDVALVSTAARAQQTFDLASAAMTVGHARNLPGLYLASPGQMLDHIRQAEGSTVLVVAHNPGTEDLAARLCGTAAGEDYERMITKFPTAAFAVLRAEVPLAEWDYGCADLRAFEVARG